MRRVCLDPAMKCNAVKPHKKRLSETHSLSRKASSAFSKVTVVNVASCTHSKSLLIQVLSFLFFPCESQRPLPDTMSNTNTNTNTSTNTSNKQGTLGNRNGGGGLTNALNTEFCTVGTKENTGYLIFPASMMPHPILRFLSPHAH